MMIKPSFSLCFLVWWIQDASAAALSSAGTDIDKVNALEIYSEKRKEFPLVSVVEDGDRWPGFKGVIELFTPRIAYAFQRASMLSIDDTTWSYICDILYRLTRETRAPWTQTTHVYTFKKPEELAIIFEKAIADFMGIAEKAYHRSALAVYRRKESEYSGVVDVIKGTDDHPGFEHTLASSPKSVQEAFLVAAGSCDDSKIWSEIVDVLSMIHYYPRSTSATGRDGEIERAAMFSKATADFYRIEILSRALKMYRKHILVLPRVPVISDNIHGLPGFEKLITDLPSDILFAFTIKSENCWDESCWFRITDILYHLLQASYQSRTEGDRRALKPLSQRQEALEAAFVALSA